MSRQEVYREVEDEFGFIPDFMKILPDDTLEHDWHLIKSLELRETDIPMKFKHLIGVAIAGALRSKYAASYHKEMAKTAGATDDEIREVARYAALTSSWSTILDALQVDIDEFRDDIRRMAKFRKRKMQRMEKVAI